jgi:hypothetical protein
MTRTVTNLANRHRWALRLAAAALTLAVASQVQTVSVQARPEPCGDYCSDQCDSACVNLGGCKEYHYEPNGTPPYTCGCITRCFQGA